jgi:hypothetical protein
LPRPLTIPDVLPANIAFNKTGVFCEAERGRSNGLEQAMLWKLVYASAIVLLITSAADAQSNTGGAQLNSEAPTHLGIPLKSEAPPTQEQIERQRTIDKAYEATMQKLPDKKSSADPWGGVRPTSPATTKSKQQ